MAEYLDDAEEISPQPGRPGDSSEVGADLIYIAAGELKAAATLNRSATARALWNALPIGGRAKIWGDEVYFEIPLTCPPENAQADVPSGTIAYWPDGNCFCIFFGQKPYSPVNILGTLQCDPNIFRAVREGKEIRLERPTGPTEQPRNSNRQAAGAARQEDKYKDLRGNRDFSIGDASIVNRADLSIRRKTSSKDRSTGKVGETVRKCI